ncbi:MAG: sulfotransferase family 2 domain-containing protein [Methylohalobius sp. ZOD2]
MSDDYLSWSPSLGKDLPKTVLKSLWLLPHDLRRSAFKKLFPKAYWRLMALRRGIYPPYDYFFCERYSTIFVHIPKAAGQYISINLLNGHAGHQTISDYQFMFGSEVFNRSFKFTFTRNPWDRLVSAYFYLKKGGCNEHDKEWSQKHLSNYDTFDQFVRDLPQKRFFDTWIHFIPQHKFITDPLGRISVDYIGQVENLSQQIQVICEKIKINPPANPKKTNTSDHKHYSEYYTPETIQIVEGIYKRDLELFGYRFET